MNEFMLPALRESYAFKPGNNVRKQSSEGGKPRQVIAFVGAVHTVNATVALVDEQHQEYFWSFWRQHQGKSWEWELVLDQGDLESCECIFDSEVTPSESNRGFEFLRISFQVLVVPKERDETHDQNILKLWETGIIKVYDNIEKVPNVWFPKATGD